MKKMILIFALMVLSGCILVEDDHGWWEKAYRDQRLIGTWKEAKAASDPFEIYDSGEGYLLSREGDKLTSTKIKSVEFSGLMFLLLRDDHDEKPSYSLVGYDVNKDVLKSYAIDLDNKHVVDRYFPELRGQNSALRVATIKTLDDKAILKLVALYSNPANYETRTYTRVR